MNRCCVLCGYEYDEPLYLENDGEVCPYCVNDETDEEGLKTIFQSIEDINIYKSIYTY